MFSEFQKTLSEPLKFEGVGLHSEKIKNNIASASDNEGIMFKRTDVSKII